MKKIFMIALASVFTFGAVSAQTDTKAPAKTEKKATKKAKSTKKPASKGEATKTETKKTETKTTTDTKKK